MAEDARISTALPSHPKARKLKRRLGPAGCWSLVVLFLWVASNRWDGDLKGMTEEDIELAAEWEGEPGAFVHALSEVGFLDGEPDSFTVHDWTEHNPWAASRGQRIEVAKRAAAKRWGCVPHAESMQAASDQQTERMPDIKKSNAPNPTQPDQTKTRKSKACGRPSLEEVTAYCQERGKGVDPQKWFDHYASNGWKVGRNPMKDWKAAVRTWEKNGVNYGNGNGNRAQQRQINNLAALNDAFPLDR